MVRQLRFLWRENFMRKVALLVLVGLGGAALGSLAWGDPLTVNPSMLSSTTALSAGSVAPSADAPPSGPGLPAMVVTPRQATSSQMPGDCPSCTNAHFGTTIARTAPTDAPAAPGVYGAQLTTTLGAAGTVAAADADDNDPAGFATRVPSALQFSAVPSSTQTSLGGTSPSDRALTK
jgi:hypothetical protein